MGLTGKKENNLMGRPLARPLCTCCGGCVKSDTDGYCDKKPSSNLMVIGILVGLILIVVFFMALSGGIG